MSTGPRIFLGVVTSLIAVTFALLGVVAGTAGAEVAKGPWPFYGLAAFSTCIALACLVPRSRPVTLRLIGAAVFATYTVYLYQDFDKPKVWRAFLCVFGLPAAYVAVMGKYPRWGKAAAAFGSGPYHKKAQE
jgi:hypothetical protein